VRLPGEHTPRLEGLDAATDTLTLVCQCGWTRELTDDEAWGPDDAWRRLAAAHPEPVAS
jgi:hypothetical protein